MNEGDGTGMWKGKKLYKGDEGVPHSDENLADFICKGVVLSCIWASLGEGICSPGPSWWSESVLAVAEERKRQALARKGQPNWHPAKEKAQWRLLRAKKEMKMPDEYDSWKEVDATIEESRIAQMRRLWQIDAARAHWTVP
mmetsp:Transcript_13320/g.46081  ORF Transcript_13320/g.46081 Transcript_13320/m.46081 type:complete len:141 (-) Transcript_13320:1063-1485(-)